MIPQAVNDVALGNDPANLVAYRISRIEQEAEAMRAYIQSA